jgi:hypothetical protein
MPFPGFLVDNPNNMDARLAEMLKEIGHGTRHTLARLSRANSIPTLTPLL